MYNFSDDDYNEKKPRTVPVSVIEQRQQNQEQKYQAFLKRRDFLRRAKIKSLGYEYDSLSMTHINKLLRGGTI